MPIRGNLHGRVYEKNLQLYQWAGDFASDRVEEEEEGIYEVINVHKLKGATPNLRVINLYGINFVDDSHIDAFSSNCIQLECLAVNYCAKVTGSTLKTLFQRSRRLICLLMNGTKYLMQVEWEKCLCKN
ncbi:hypothetical protein NQ317_010939 [Molorchus minor]|uniref:Uncharacterized protein n=1 Tax=Molorchus minor TaxID=1323400 RepID=A0ABQ9JNL8_9CUCU|nr:hypothetical protein NQ317_010939 [Molorchus minor]